MTNEEKERIEDEAIKYGQKVMEKTKDSHDGINAKYAYIAGATSENERLSAEIERLKKLSDKLLSSVAGMTDQIKSLGYYPDHLDHEIEALLEQRSK